ncbi:MAG: hypothetical protein ABFD83_10310 [Armatimonadota bacterium]
MIPPILLRLKIGKRRIVVPLFLLWPLAILLAPIAIIICITLAICNRQARYLTLLHKLYIMTCALRGLEIDVKDKEDVVLISIK